MWHNKGKDVWRLTLDLLMSLAVSFDSDLLTVFLDGGRWMELILGSVWQDDDVLSQMNTQRINRNDPETLNVLVVKVLNIPSFTTALYKPTLSYKEKSNTK